MKWQVKIISQSLTPPAEGVRETDLGTYRLVSLSHPNLKHSQRQKHSSQSSQNHTMLRVKDPTTALNFYQQTMGTFLPQPSFSQTRSPLQPGMTLINRSLHHTHSYTTYLLGYSTTSSRTETSRQGGLLELHWDHGTEKLPSFTYHDGNGTPQGFGHVCVSVDDLDVACARFEGENVRWKKRLTEGKMKNVAFVLDPDGYWIEVRCHYYCC